MTDSDQQPVSAGSADENAELDRLGIVRVPSDTFSWTDFRYSHARDASAAAKRGAAQ